MFESCSFLEFLAFGVDAIGVVSVSVVVVVVLVVLLFLFITLPFLKLSSCKVDALEQRMAVKFSCCGIVLAEDTATVRFDADGCCGGGDETDELVDDNEVLRIFSASCAASFSVVLANLLNFLCKYFELFQFIDGEEDE